jgi:RHS repeat-associated protein
VAPSYDAKGNLASYNGSTYSYDAHNQLKIANKNGNNVPFYYDAFGRQILRNVNGQWIYSIWDGWNLIEERTVNDTVIHGYVHGAAIDELVYRAGPGGPPIWYYQDAQGSTSHLADDHGNLIESYKYPPVEGGAPSIYDQNGNPLAASAVGNRFLFTGRDWIKEISLYDYRHRFYIPSLGRFLQPDPIGFAGDPANLYRYCRNNSVNNVDPSGLDVVVSWYSASFPVTHWGHIGLGVNTAATSGFYGAIGASRTGFVGSIQLDSTTNRGDRLGSLIIATTPAQDQIIAAVFAQFNGTAYDVMDRNCATAVAAALKAAGLKFDSSNKPNVLFKNLVKAFMGKGGKPTMGPSPGGGGGHGGESNSGTSGSGVSIGPSVAVVGFYNVDPASGFFAALMAAFPNAVVVQQSGLVGGGGKNIPILMLF